MPEARGLRDALREVRMLPFLLRTLPELGETTSGQRIGGVLAPGRGEHYRGKRARRGSEGAERLCFASHAQCGAARRLFWPMCGSLPRLFA
eukprot:9230129-Pyramimonas_sp.AAC.1